ncbi:SMI1/KNR4 family protein [Nocardiopsis lucentensis]|uniref:SMI1/KNR4 family protein n=1 Tax=Nocardiopsis lucentensis TaxID=53441 RepID=UPI000346FDA9|nr:SMI1/KNR4 family protein [Nocardiopsis lucentensis]
MGTTIWNGVRERVEALARADRPRDVLGAWGRHGTAGHRFRLTAPLAESEVAAAEARWGVSLPADYRGFLLEVGAGGAGPQYGLSTLHRTDTGWEWTDPGGDMRHDSLRVAFPTAGERSRHLAAHEVREPARSGFGTQEAFDTAYRVWRDADDDLFDWFASGALCLNHAGCGHCHWLVVTGPERGSMWVDGFSDDGFRPLGTPGARVGFADWYLSWLARCEAADPVARDPRP